MYCEHSKIVFAELSGGEERAIDVEAPHARRGRRQLLASTSRPCRPRKELLLAVSTLIVKRPIEAFLENLKSSGPEKLAKMAEHSHPPIPPAPQDGWKNEGVRVIPADSLDSNTAQTPGMDRAAAINFARVGAQKLWAGTVHIHPNAKTGAHHHGHLEVGRLTSESALP